MRKKVFSEMVGGGVVFDNGDIPKKYKW